MKNIDGLKETTEKINELNLTTEIAELNKFLKPFKEITEKINDLNQSLNHFKIK